MLAEVPRAGWQQVKMVGMSLLLQTVGSNLGQAGGAARPSPGLEDSHPHPRMKTLTAMVAAPGTSNPGLWSPTLLGKKERGFCDFPFFTKTKCFSGILQLCECKPGPGGLGRTIRPDT